MRTQPSAAEAMRALNHQRNRLTGQQYRTIRGQIRSGQPGAAMAGLDRLLNRSHAVAKEEVADGIAEHDGGEQTDQQADGAKKIDE